MPATASRALLPVHAFWIGPQLGPISRSCLLSFLRVGHAVTLHGYERPVDLPAGIAFSDAADLIPPDRIIRHRESGSYSLFSNVIRYRLLQLHDGIWVDCDVFCLRPLEPAEYLFGFEDGGTINTAVLDLPPESDLLRALNEVAADRAPIPPWLPPKLQKQLRKDAARGKTTSVEDLPWGVLGPRALTWLARERGLEVHAEPADTFYPVHFSKVHRLLDPGLSIEQLITHRTRCIHLYNEKLRWLDLSNIAPSSPLGQMMTLDR
ncbi:capsular polysaccharide synthesis protein [Ancylobacter lacus]|uniref:capsular polysaccharide synthesis protein n=1 Tax=Ancylobacter lacus TaxID=2579970 RepID=UPI001BD0155A|nr:capsular polysaccharide synthesis protein [Ancylobacter lacus]MBS7539677.1 hypothetical protein [Ancylobacter lacus]